VIGVPQIAAAWDQGWLDLNKAASVEVSSEDENCPIESALLGDEQRGRRAAERGTQTIRLVFDSPQSSKDALGLTGRGGSDATAVQVSSKPQ
jgi:hypothetical protein